MTIMTHYGRIKQNIRDKAIACGRDPEGITLIAVTKTCSAAAIQSAYQEGCRDFGESRVQEVLKKIPQLPEDCKWHMIGTLQSNKVAKAISSFHLIHSVDNPLLAQKISQISQERGVVTPILLQVNTSGEVTKHGLSEKEWEYSLESINRLTHIRIEGLMTIAPFTDDQNLIRSSFRKLYLLQETWRNQMNEPAIFQHLSMGMSHDYIIAIEEGATLLRIGTAIFGDRPHD